MRILTPDDLQWLDRIGVDDKRMKIILSNQTDAEQWKFYYDGGLNGLMDIKERLIKRIELYKEQLPLIDKEETKNWAKNRIIELEKILKGKNGLSK